MNYLNKVIEASKQRVETQKKPQLNIKFGKVKSEVNKNQEQSVTQLAKTNSELAKNQLANLDLGDSDDDEDDQVNVDTATAMAENLDFYRKQSAQMENLANRVEKQFSLSKQVTEEKIPELLKRKTSMQMNLESDIGGVQKVREAKMK